MDQKTRFVLEWRSGTISKTALCHLFGISRQTGYKWANRVKRRRSLDALQEQSRRPKHCPRATPRKLEKLIVSQRRQYPTWGPIPIRRRLHTLWPGRKWPSASTIGAILKRHGLVPVRQLRSRLPPRTKPFSKCREPNDVWCIDFKGQFLTRDGKPCYPLTVMDAATRYLLACVAFRAPTLDNVQHAMTKLFEEYGLPKAIRSDNGEPFVASTAAGGLSKLSAWWAKLGIQLERIDPGKPQQNGRHERMHLTLKIETCSPPRASIGHQQRAFDRFRRVYNEIRPHQALELQTPGSLYQPSQRRLPATPPVLTYPFSECHRVSPSGTIVWGKKHLFVNSALAGELVGVNQLSARYAQVGFANVVLGLIDCFQPQRGLIRPKIDRRGTRETRVSAMSPV